jgi:hypothetical protein
VPPALNLLQAIRWKEQVYRDEAVPEQERPCYLRGGAEFDILRKGIIFLRRKRYGLALEWWSLHRQRRRLRGP